MRLIVPVQEPDVEIYLFLLLPTTSPTSRVPSPQVAPEDPSFPNPKCPTSPPLLATLAAGAGRDGGAYPSDAAVGRGGGFLRRCSGELVGSGGPWAAWLAVAGA
jgi:hypothetical protein